jgi:hypothetical protein
MPDLELLPRASSSALRENLASVKSRYSSYMKVAKTLTTGFGQSLIRKKFTTKFKADINVNKSDCFSPALCPMDASCQLTNN